ncbi:unnamed protein product [Caenorhabditis sp. 36 PRJEB53466]|nr:unnamed protein product [Caenorhabditis sp. 36 PRJEB53466]
MIFLVNGSHQMWVPIPILNKALYTSSKYVYVQTVDVVTFIITACLVLRATYVIWSSKVFHINLRLILIFQMLQWFEILVSRILMFDYLVGRRFVGDYSKIYHRFWTDDPSEMVPIRSALDEWTLFLGGFLYTHHYASCLFFLFSVSAERAVASYFLSDYEAYTRPHISILLICVSMAFSSGYSLIYALNFFTFLASSFLIVLIAVSSCSLYGYVYYYNTRVMRMGIDENRTTSAVARSSKYTLSRRFQTRENLKSLSMAKWAVTTHAVYVGLCQMCLMCVYFGHDSDDWEKFVYVMDAVVCYSNAFIVLFVIVSTDTWTRAFFRPCFLFRHSPNRVSTSECDELRAVHAEKISTSYFEQLGKAWS